MLLGSSIYASFVKSENRVKFSILAAIAVTLPVVAMIFELNIIMIVIFNAVYGFFNTFNATPVLNTHFKVMEELGLGSEYGAEVHLLREFFCIHWPRFRSFNGLAYTSNHHRNNYSSCMYVGI